MTTELFLISFGFPRIFEQFTAKIFTQSTESVSPQYRCLPKLLLNKEVSNVLCEKPIILLELLFELRIVVIQDGKRTACKKMRWENSELLQNVR